MERAGTMRGTSGTISGTARVFIFPKPLIFNAEMWNDEKRFHAFCRSVFSAMVSTAYQLNRFVQFAVPFRRSSAERSGTIFDKRMKGKDKKRNDFLGTRNDPSFLPLAPRLFRAGGWQWKATRNAERKDGK